MDGRLAPRLALRWCCAVRRAASPDCFHVSVSQLNNAAGSNGQRQHCPAHAHTHVCLGPIPLLTPSQSIRGTAHPPHCTLLRSATAAAGCCRSLQAIVAVNDGMITRSHPQQQSGCCCIPHTASATSASCAAVLAELAARCADHIRGYTSSPRPTGNQWRPQCGFCRFIDRPTFMSSAIDLPGAATGCCSTTGWDATKVGAAATIVGCCTIAWDASGT